MNAKPVVLTGLKMMGVAAGLGAVVGVLLGLKRESDRMSQVDMARVAFPTNVNNFSEFSEPLMHFAQIGSPDMTLLRRVARKCSNLLILYTMASQAAPSTVKPSIIAASRQFATSIETYLRDFYRSSHVAMVSVKRADDNTRTWAPADRHHRHMHDMLITTVDALVFNLTLVVKSKMEQAVVEAA